MQLLPNLKRSLLILSLFSNLSVLFYFKYSGFFLDQIEFALNRIGVYATSPALPVLVPIGLSFIIFHGISFVVDSYSGRQRTQPEYLEYLVYIAYFPKLLAGPITRFSDFVPELRASKVPSLRTFTSGAQLVLIGLFKKLVVAAVFAMYWMDLKTQTSGGALLVYAAGACYGLYLLADFSGYTDIARGVSRILGIELPKNFNLPYAATSLSDFWRRWHLSLSFWLRDYVYIPLGGSRRGLPRTVMNIFVTMVLCGLWHGASWSFIVWGAVHGLIMGFERVARQVGQSVRVPAMLGLALTWIVVCLTWLIFALPDLSSTQAFVWTAFEVDSPVASNVVVAAIIATVLGPIASAMSVYENIILHIERSDVVAAAVNTIIILLILFQLWSGSDVSQFVYFNF